MPDTNLETTDAQVTHFETFEAQLERLQTIVKALDDPRVPLAEMLALYSEGMTLAQTCRTILDNASQQISEIGRTSSDEAFSEALFASDMASTKAEDGLLF